MPRKKQEQIEKPVEVEIKEERPKQKGTTYEVAKAFERYSSFLLEGGVVVPVNDGKVSVASEEIVNKLREGGFIE